MDHLNNSFGIRAPTVILCPLWTVLPRILIGIVVKLNTIERALWTFLWNTVLTLWDAVEGMVLWTSPGSQAATIDLFTCNEQKGIYYLTTEILFSCWNAYNILISQYLCYG